MLGSTTVHMLNILHDDNTSDTPVFIVGAIGMSLDAVRSIGEEKYTKVASTGVSVILSLRRA